MSLLSSLSVFKSRLASAVNFKHCSSGQAHTERLPRMKTGLGQRPKWSQSTGFSTWVFCARIIYPLSWWQGSSQRQRDFGFRSCTKPGLSSSQEGRGDNNQLLPEILPRDSSVGNALPSPLGRIKNFSKVKLWNIRIITSLESLNSMNSCRAWVILYSYVLPQCLAQSLAQKR